LRVEYTINVFGGDTCRLEFYESVGLERAGEFGLAERTDGLGRIKEAGCSGREGITPGSKDLAPRFDLVARNLVED